MKNNLEARTRLISEEKLQRELALQRFAKNSTTKSWEKRIAVSFVALMVALASIAAALLAEAHKNLQVSAHNYCMVYDCLTTPEAAKDMEHEGYGKVPTESDIE